MSGDVLLVGVIGDLIGYLCLLVLYGYWLWVLGLCGVYVLLYVWVGDLV